MNRVSASIIASAALLGLAACADSVTKVAAPVDLQPSLTQYPEFNDSHGHIMKIRSEGEKDVAQSERDLAEARGNAKPGGSGGSTGILYHGGPVLQAQTNVAAIYWAASPIYKDGPTPGSNNSTGSDNSLIAFFLRNLGPSSYFNINSTYYDGGNNYIANLVNYTQFWANNGSVPSAGQNVSDTQMLLMLQSGFQSGNLTYNAGTLYAIFTAGTVNLGGGFGTQYCAYHTHGNVTLNNGSSVVVLYAAMPYDYAYQGACTNGSAAANGTLDPGADAEVNTLAHEVEETTTDMMGNAWFDRRGYENADKCAWTWGGTYTSAAGGVANIQIGGKDFLVQQNWINTGSGGCRKSYP